ncbi:MAG: hypothetical protein HXY52_02170 [Nitrospirae bacterium]|jgi:hypothetical protein|nr:hypothetical protein [Nitrospirota bacterium]
MLTLEELKKDRKLVNSIDWEMTPEMAVRVHLEWGNVWSDINRGYLIRSKNDYSVYFQLNCSSKPCFLNLIQLSPHQAVDIAKIEVPEKFQNKFCNFKGVYAPEEELKEWLKKELNVN